MKSFGEYKINPKDFDKIVNMLSGNPKFEYDKTANKRYLMDLKDEFNAFLENFLFKTKERFEFANFDVKLSSLRIKELSLFQAFFLGIGGYYDIDTHQIKVAYPIETSIYHELFHAFTSFRINNSTYGTGFSYHSKGINIGSMFDEGYTDYLTFEYFNNPIYYGKEANIAQKVELIIGKDKMEKMYCKNDLVGLINFLSSFSSFDEAIKFLMLMDRFSIRDTVTHEELRIINDISNYLVDLYINCLAVMYRNGEIDMASLTARLEEFKIHFSDYIFKNEFETQYYEKSSDYVDITHKLSKKRALHVIDEKMFREK